MSFIFRNFLRTTTPRFVLGWTVDCLGIFCAAILIREHFYTVQRSEGPSMIPTFSVRGDWLLISRRHDHGKNIKVGDVVRFSHPSFLGVNGAKRVIGMPGDFVCKDPVYSTDVGANNEMIQVCFCYNASVGVEADWGRCRKDMSSSRGIICLGREIREITDLCRWD